MKKAIVLFFSFLFLFYGNLSAQAQQVFEKLLSSPPGCLLSGCTFSGPVTVTTLSAIGAITTNYIVAGPPTQFGEVNANGTFNWPISSAGGCCRLHYWNDNVTVTGNQAGGNVIESNFFNLNISGSGTLTGEAFNIVHPHVYIPSGVTISGYAENIETSYLNDGTSSGTLYGNFSRLTNGAGTMGTMSAYTVQGNNNNATIGSVGTFQGYECQAFGGSGSAPTINWCFVNRDSNATISSAGGVRIGPIGISNGPGTLQVIGPDASGGTCPVVIQNNATQIFRVCDDGTTTVNDGVFQLGIANNWGKLLFGNTTSGQLVLVAPSTGALSGLLTLPNVTGTLVATATVAASPTAPTYASGGCSTHSAITSNGTVAFSIQMTGTCTGSQPIVFTLPAATTSWACSARDVTTATNAPKQTGAQSTTSVTITNYAITTGIAGAWTTGDVVEVACSGY
ncbi:MAG: hypothetical protein KGJ90_07205 [Patescibacteria group bacterium]|nr:hypothetical protein [Patescibacteria group bacterium]MDE2233860.1 hypothetical protein [Patescibacteria group bacterium]